jgi:hypothetical protein
LAALVLSPWLYSVDPAVGKLVWMILVVILCALHSLGFVVAWPAIVRAATNNSNRGSITARLRAIQVIVASIVSVAIAILGVNYFNGLAYSVLCVVLVFFSIDAFRQVDWMSKNVAVQTQEREKAFWIKLFDDCRFFSKDKELKLLSCLVFAFGFIGLPLQIFYLDLVLNLQRGMVFWFVAASTVISIVSTLMLGSTIDKKGAEFAGQIGLMFVGFGLLLQMFILISHDFSVAVNPAQAAIAIFSLFFVNIGGQALALIWFNLALRILSPQRTTNGAMILGSIFEFGVVLSSTLSGLILHSDGNSLHIANGVNTTHYALFLTAVFLVATWCYIPIHRLKSLK